MQNFLLKGFGVLVPSFLLTLTMNAQSVPAPQQEQGAIFKELSYLNQNFKNPVKKRNGFSLVASTYELYTAAQFVKGSDSLRYKWVGNRGETFDVFSPDDVNQLTYTGEVFNPLTGASELTNALYNYDTIEFYRLTANNNTYGNLYKRRIAELDANAMVSANSEQRLNNNNWQDNIVTSYLFDNQNRMIELVEQRTLGGVLTNYSKNAYTYNSADKVDIVTSSVWSSGSANWVNSYKFSHAYDNNNNLIDYTVEIWQNGNWDKLTRVLFEYDNNNKVTSRISQMGATGSWENSRVWYYSYVNNNMTGIESRGWTSGSWADISYLYEFSYNNSDQCISKTEYVMNMPPDTLIYRTLFDYNGVNEIENITWQTGTGNIEALEDLERWVFEHGNAGLAAYSSQRKINNTWSYFDEGANPGDQSFMQRYYYSDSEPVSISSPKQVALNYSVYPNPASTHLSVAIDKDDIQYIVITDLSGREMLKVNYANKVKKAEVDISRIASGNYILTVGNASEYGVQKLSITK